jgi:hypothetical protein
LLAIGTSSSIGFPNFVWRRYTMGFELPREACPARLGDIVANVRVAAGDFPELAFQWSDPLG